MIIGSIAIRMSADAQPFIAEVQESADALDRVAASAERAQSAFAGLDLSKSSGAGPGSGGGLDAAALGSQFDTLASRIHGSLLSALAPLGTFAATFSRQFSAVGGTVMETSRRVATALKYMGAESIKNLYGKRMADPETFKVEVNKKTLKDVIGLTAQQATSVRTVSREIEGMNNAQRGLGTEQLEKMLEVMKEIAAASRDAVKQMAAMAARADAIAARPISRVRPRTRNPTVVRDPGASRAAIDVKDGVHSIAAEAPKAAQQVGGIGREASAVGRFFGHVNETLRKQVSLVERLRKGAASLAPAATGWSSKLKLDKDANNLLFGKDVGRGLASLGKGAALNRTIQEASLLGSQFRMLHAPIRTATGLAKGLGETVSVGLGLAGLGFKAVQFGVGFLKSGIAGASDLNETVDKTGHVFGASASIIVRAGDEMSRSFGLSKREFIDGATNLGRFGKAAGLSQDASARLGVDLARLGADLASIENIDTATAMQRLSSGIAGETEVLRKHGALLSEERIKQEAVTKGWSDGKGELSEQTKVMSRVSLIFKDLKDAQGNLAETADSPANAMRRFGGQVENLATAVGQMLLPAVSKALEVGSEFVTRLSAGFEAMKGAGAGFVAEIVNGFELVGLALRNLPDFAEIAWIKMKDLGQNFIQVLAVIPDNINLIADYLSTNWRKVLFDLYNSTRTMSDNIDKNFVALFRSIQDFFAGKGWKFNWTPLLDGFQATAEKLPELLRPQLVSSQAEIDKITDRIGRRESQRKKTPAESVNPTLPDFDDADKDKGKDKKKGRREDKEVAALEFGSAEAASAVAKYRNEGGPDQQPAKATAKNTEDLVKVQRESLAYLKRAMDSKDPVKLAVAKL